MRLKRSIDKYNYQATMSNCNYKNKPFALFNRSRRPKPLTHLKSKPLYGRETRNPNCSETILYDKSNSNVIVCLANTMDRNLFCNLPLWKMTDSSSTNNKDCSEARARIQKLEQYLSQSADAFETAYKDKENDPSNSYKNETPDNMTLLLLDKKNELPHDLKDVEIDTSWCEGCAMKNIEYFLEVYDIDRYV